MKKPICICAALLALAGAGLCLFWPSPAPAPKAATKKPAPAKRIIPDAAPKFRAKAPAKAKPNLRVAREATGEEDDAREMTPQEEKLVDDIQDALDNENFNSVKKFAEDAARSSNPEVRERAVDALQWFGAEAMPELTLFMADENEDVRNGACSAWTMALSQVEDPKTKAGLVQGAMEIVRDRDELEMMVMEMDDLDEKKQVEILKKLIRGSNKTAADVAREHYEFVTGDKYGAAPQADEGED